jgi:CRISPR-associated exonuclease Cas4
MGLSTTMYTEDELLPLSALQHICFCERQCALIHIEQQWIENLYTAEGRIMHERVHMANRESRGKIRIECGVPLRSLTLGLVGQADVVEFHKIEGLQGRSQLWHPFPVEYKRGKAKKENWDRVQLCAQAICLEEMLGVVIPGGALFYGKTRRRQDVAFDQALRAETTDAARRLHALVASDRTPEPVYAARCESCSFIGLCLPKTMGKQKSALDYLQKIMKET